MNCDDKGLILCSIDRNVKTLLKAIEVKQENNSKPITRILQKVMRGFEQKKIS